MNQSILRHDTVALAPTGDAIRIIDQTQLPAQLVFLDLHTQPEIWRAIERLQVRGAPAIGVAAAYGLYLAAREISGPRSRQHFCGNFTPPPTIWPPPAPQR